MKDISINDYKGSDIQKGFKDVESFKAPKPEETMFINFEKGVITEQELCKALETFDLVKGKKAQVGETRNWGNGRKAKKLADGSWKIINPAKKEKKAEVKEPMPEGEENGDYPSSHKLSSSDASSAKKLNDLFDEHTNGEIDKKELNEKSSSIIKKLGGEESAKKKMVSYNAAEDGEGFGLDDSRDHTNNFFKLIKTDSASKKVSSKEVGAQIDNALEAILNSHGKNPKDKIQEAQKKSGVSSDAFKGLMKTAAKEDYNLAPNDDITEAEHVEDVMSAVESALKEKKAEVKEPKVEMKDASSYGNYKKGTKAIEIGEENLATINGKELSIGLGSGRDSKWLVGKVDDPSNLTENKLSHMAANPSKYGLKETSTDPHENSDDYSDTSKKVSKGDKDAEANTHNVKTADSIMKKLEQDIDEAIDEDDEEDPEKAEAATDRFDSAMSSAIKKNRITKEQFNEAAKKYRGLDLMYEDYK